MNINLAARIPSKVVTSNGLEVASYLSGETTNQDARTIRSFGEEWLKFHRFHPEEIEEIGGEYFDLVSDHELGTYRNVLDAGCGSGRWTRYLASRVEHIEAIDPSEAIYSAAAINSDLKNVNFSQAAIEDLPFCDDSFDLIVCLGVLHHMPDTEGGLRSLASKLRPGGKIVLYLYYNLDNRGWLYRTLFRATDRLRLVISGLPGPTKRVLCDLIALTVYFPCASVVRLAKNCGFRSFRRFPLSTYANKSFTVMRNDALDRFGTPLEKRFSRRAIDKLLTNCGFEEIEFSNRIPFHHCIATKRTGNVRP